MSVEVGVLYYIAALSLVGLHLAPVFAYHYAVRRFDKHSSNEISSATRFRYSLVVRTI